MNALTARSQDFAQADPRFGSVPCLFFVIGAQKAGTTWLSHYFQRHPNVAVPYWKEHFYWNMVEGRPDPGHMLIDREKRRARDGRLKRLRDGLTFTAHGRRQRAITLALAASKAPRAPHTHYADVLLENVGKDTGAMGELCPQYALLRASTFAEMSRLSDNVRFIFIMRDPLSRFISGVQHHMRRTLDSAEMTNAALSAKLKRFALDDSSQPLLRSRYDATIARLEQSVPRERIRYVFFERLFDQDQLRGICEFLGVPFVPAPLEKRRNGSGKSDLKASDADRALIARQLRPVYDFALERFGADLPEKWRESAALAGVQGAAVPDKTLRALGTRHDSETRGGT